MWNPSLSLYWVHNYFIFSQLFWYLIVSFTMILHVRNWLHLCRFLLQLVFRIRVPNTTKCVNGQSCHIQCSNLHSTKQHKTKSLQNQKHKYQKKGKQKTRRNGVCQDARKTNRGSNSFQNTNNGCCESRINNGAQEHCVVENNAHY